MPRANLGGKATEPTKYVCPECGHESEDAGSCPDCQVPLVATCPMCGNPIVGEQIEPIDAEWSLNPPL